MTERIQRIEEFAAASPLAAWLGFTVADEKCASYELAFHEAHIGNPAIRALHGGVIASFLELSMQAELVGEYGGRVSTVNISIDYLSSSKPQNMTARVRRLKVGRRIAFLEAEGWQAGETRLVAVARACFNFGRR
ncbi:MAG: PaaI family thioesterase [Parvularculaceae bacterium]|nr:PaaI family thioesterase [Parvularculaceae bacterium]